MNWRIRQLYELSLINPEVTKCYDIHEHLPVLKKYGETCSHITEMGVRWGASTLAFVMAAPAKLVSYDIQSTPEIESILADSQKIIRHEFRLADSLAVEIEPTDLLFIDTLHVYRQLRAELIKHSPKVRKYIILHDTTTFGREEEEMYDHASALVQSLPPSEKKGLRTAMEDFLAENTGWILHEDLTNNNGLSILKRQT